MRAKRLACVGGLTGGDWIPTGQLRKGSGREGHEGSRNNEGKGRMHSGPRGGRSYQHVDTCADGDA